MTRAIAALLQGCWLCFTERNIRRLALRPVLAAAVRSVRQPEARAGLAAVVASLASNANLAQAVSHHLPELEIVSAEALL